MTNSKPSRLELAIWYFCWTFMILGIAFGVYVLLTFCKL